MNSFFWVLSIRCPKGCSVILRHGIESPAHGYRIVRLTCMGSVSKQHSETQHRFQDAVFVLSAVGRNSSAGRIAHIRRRKPAYTSHFSEICSWHLLSYAVFSICALVFCFTPQFPTTLPGLRKAWYPLFPLFFIQKRLPLFETALPKFVSIPTSPALCLCATARSKS